MADWILVPCLVKLRSEFNQIAPNRDKESDGSIGDRAHQQSQSDHNDDEIGNVPIHDADKIHEVHAIDVDVDLREPGLTMEAVVQFLLNRCRSGAERRLRYIIFNRRIWSASNGWKQQTYSGSNPHDHHAHFSSSYDTVLEASTASWKLEDVPVALTQNDKDFITSEIEKSKKSILTAIADLARDMGQKVWGFVMRNPYRNVDQPASDFQRFAPSSAPTAEVEKKVVALDKKVDGLAEDLRQIKAALLLPNDR